MAILAILVGLVVPNFFGVTDESEAIQIQGQHEKMREAVYLYHSDTSRWPNEWSGAPLTTTAQHQLWLADGVSGWDGPYIDRPILQKNRWGGNWGVRDGRRLNLTLVDNTAAGGGLLYTVLMYEDVPNVVAEALDEAMDDGDRTTGAVQWGGDNPGNSSNGGGDPDDKNVLLIVIAKQ